MTGTMELSSADTCNRITTEMIVTVLADTRTRVQSGHLQVPILVIDTGSGWVTFQAPEMPDGSGPCLLTEFAYELAEEANRCATITRELCDNPDHVHPAEDPDPDDDESGPADDDDDDDSDDVNPTQDDATPATVDEEHR